MNQLRRITKRIPYIIWIVILISYIMPFFIVRILTEQGIRDMRWFLYIIPVIFFSYYFGLRGGLISSFLSNVFFLSWEWGETIGHVYRPRWENDLNVTIAIVNLFIAAGIGILANRLNLLLIKDPLTNLFNRRYIENYQLDKKKVTVLFVDIDRFKLINDSFGHRVGDMILQSVSQRLNHQIKKHDFVARLAGDEFVCVFYEVDVEKIKTRAEEILRILSTVCQIEGYEFYMTASIGISQSSDNEELHDLIMRADIAMYEAKKEGKNRYLFYTQNMHVATVERLEMERYLHEALQNQQFVLHYQPRMDLKSNTMIGMEALVRLQHPFQGLIKPQKFIPIAEDTGLIIPIGEWILYTACKQNKEWQDAGFAPLRVSVNISARQFNQNLVESVQTILDEIGLAPQWVELEITESMLVNNVEQVIHILHNLKKIGVHISIDDFGTGYSSLSYLRQFPIDVLKIDQSFIQDILSDVSIVKSIVNLGLSLNMEVVAEGIEKEEQVCVLQMENCFYGQGFLFSHPVDKQEFERILIGLDNLNATEYEETSLRRFSESPS